MLDWLGKGYIKAITQRKTGLISSIELGVRCIKRPTFRVTEYKLFKFKT
jgi:hypothetical protein